MDEPYDKASDFVNGCKGQKNNTGLFTGNCPHCGQELEFFTVAEIRKQEYCYHCQAKFDREKFAHDLGLSA